MMEMMYLSTAKIETFLIVLLVSALVILPLSFFYQISNPYEFPKFILYVVLSQVALLIIVGSINKIKTIPLYKNRLFLLLVGFCLITLFANLFGEDPRISLLGSTWRHQGFITLLSSILIFFSLYLQSSTVKKKLTDTLPLIALTACLFVAGFAFWQILQVQLFHNTSIPTFQGRIVGTMGNPNFLGGYLVALLPLVLFSKKQTVFPYSWWAKLSALVMTSIIIVFTGSRSTMLALFLFPVFAYFYYSNHQARTKQVMVIGLLCVAIAAFFFLSQNQLFTRKSIWDNRQLIWSEGIKAVTEKPFLGYGQENFELVYPSSRHSKVDNAHNVFLEVAVSSGVLGLFVFVLFVSLAIYKAAFPIKIALITFLIVAQFNPVSIAQISLFWILLALSHES